MSRALIKIATIMLLVWVGISLLYLLSGLLVVLHSEEGVASIIKGTGKIEVITAITGCISLLAAFLSYRAADRSARAAESANIRAYLPDRIKTRDALSIIWNFLNSKCCARSLNINNPGAFLITREEILKIDDQREAIYSSSAAYGRDFRNRVITFYTYMKTELEAQQTLCDFDPDNRRETLSIETQKQYLEFRTSKRDEAFELLKEADELLTTLQNG